MPPQCSFISTQLAGIGPLCPTCQWLDPAVYRGPVHAFWYRVTIRLCGAKISQAVKSVLVMAGSLKRGYPDVDEDLTLIRALVDSNVPKFLADDLPLFAAIVKVILFVAG